MTVLGFITVLGILLIYFVGAWMHSIRTDVYAWIDFVWASSFLVLVAYLLSVHAATTSLLVLAMLYTLWSLRLSYHLFVRIRSDGEDSRYRQLKSQWGEKAKIKMLTLYLFEALLVPILGLPLFIVAQRGGEAGLSPWNWAGAFLFALSWLGVVISDLQLKDFKAAHRGQRAVCDVGLWRYSRHPNYFFEILLWWSYGVFALGGDSGVWGLLPGLLMSVLIIKVTGIPYSEAQSLASRGDKYRAYQVRTSKLIPWLPKRRNV